MKLYLLFVRCLIYLIMFLGNILNGWRRIYYQFKCWQFLIKYDYNHYQTWEFFSSLNEEVLDPYTIYLSYNDFVKLLEKEDVQ